MSLTAASPLPRRFGAWLGERFPVGPYAVLVALFAGSGTALARALAPAGAGGLLGPVLGGAIVLLVFFHLRVFDEHKDFASDVVAYPERVLSRGIVTLPLLFRAGLLAIAAEAAAAALVGPRALAWWGAALAFTVAMRVEFGVGDWLRERIVPYAVTHNPVVALLGMVIWACSGAGWDLRYLGYLAAVSLGSLGFEVGRKLRLPDEEVPGVESYSTALGRAGAVRLLRGVGLLAAFAAAPLCLGPAPVQLGAGALLLGGLLALFLLSGPGRPAKKVELGATLHLLLLLAASWLGALA